MQTQERVDPFSEHEMKAPPHDTVAREAEDELETDGGLPVSVDLALLEEGRSGFDRTCAVCHGVAGDGVSVVATKMTTHPPGSLIDGANAKLTPAQIYRDIRDGYNTSPSFAHELTVHERWAVVAYLDALTLSRHAIVADLPQIDRDALAHLPAKPSSGGAL
ncbi:MAG: cytochrome c [Polyangiaceae bacterium]